MSASEMKNRHIDRANEITLSQLLAIMPWIMWAHRRNNMFTFKIKLLLVALVLFLGGVSAANAQFAGGMAIKVKIPISFVVREKSFPAGEYTFARTANVSAPSFLVLRGEGGQKLIFDTMAENSLNAAPSTQLTFDVVDGHNFLSSIWVEGDFTAYELAKTKFERTLTAENKPITRMVLSDTDH
jgi:hypothetical protein